MIIISEFMDAPSVEMLKKQYEVTYDPKLVDQPDMLKTLVSNPKVQALIVRNRTQVNEQLLENASNLKVVGRLGVGLDNIDLPFCANHNIKVIPATGANSLAVAEYVIMQAMLLRRGIMTSSPAILSGAWPRQKLGEGREFSGSKLGLIGFGAIARMVAEMAIGLGVVVNAYDPMISKEDPIFKSLKVTLMEFEPLLRASDVVSLHIPLVPSTINLFNGENLAMMKQGAVLINTARGGIIDESALALALQTGKLGGAAIDVFQDEPPLEATINHFKPCQNLTLTPHIAGVSYESNQRVSQMIAEEILAYLNKS